MALLMRTRNILSINRSILKNSRRRESGYYVLLPEIGEDLPEKNPLLQENTLLPEFNGMSIEKCIAAVGKQTVEFEQAVKLLEKEVQDSENINIFKDVFEPIEKLEIPLHTTWGISKVLYFGNHSLMPTNCYFNIHKRAWTAISCKVNSKPIYEKCKQIKEQEKNLTGEERQIITKYILEGQLNGLDLNKSDRYHFHYQMRNVASKSEEFREKLEIATKMFQHKITDADKMRGFPEEFLKTIAVDPEQHMAGPWIITLKPNVLNTFLEYCPDSLLRWNIWQANVLRCSMYNEQELQTSSLVNGITNDRCDIAKYLGFKNYSEMSMVTKMAGNLETVYKFLNTLLKAAYPQQVQEIEELTAFARERGFDGKLEQWDVPYWVRKQRKSIYNYDEKMLRQYFPLPKVLSGLFQLSRTLFNIDIVEREKVDVWHRDVRFFDVYDLDISTSEPAGSFYFDPYARKEEKLSINRHSGWTLLIRNKSEVCGIKPLTSLIFNFQPPVNQNPSLITFSEVQSLFENFGVVMQQLLTRTKSAELAGLSYIEWDAIGTSRYLMSHFLYEPQVLQSISSHCETGESLDDKMVQNLRAVRTHMSGYNLCKELYLSRYDLDLHAVKKTWEKIMKVLWKEHFVFPEEKKDSHVCSWDEIFVENAGATYYGTLWSKMLAADAYSAFQEVQPGEENHRCKIGNRFKDTFLTLGGSVPASEVFRRFRGRDPSLKALIKSLNLNSI